MLKILVRWRPIILGAFLVLAVACGGGDGDTAAPNIDDELPGRDRLIAAATPLSVIGSPDEVPEGLEAVWETFAAITREYVELYGACWKLLTIRTRHM